MTFVSLFRMVRPIATPAIGSPLPEAGVAPAGAGLTGRWCAAAAVDLL